MDDREDRVDAHLAQGIELARTETEGAEAVPRGRLAAARGWMLVLFVAVLLIAWGLFNFVMVPDQPRTWDYGTIPLTPAESVYSTSRPVREPVTPAQIPALPEARPLGGAK